MAETIRHDVEIDASPTTVWGVLTDTARYPDWNPFITTLTGQLRDGAHLEAVISPPGGKARTFRPTVLAAIPERELRWRGRFLVPGLFDGEHWFTVEPLTGGRCRLTQGERFTGLLARPMRSQLGPTLLGFEQMNRALKVRAEERSPGPSSGDATTSASQ